MKIEGYDWLMSFLRINPQPSTRQSEGLSVDRSNGMKQEAVGYFFQILSPTFEENNFFTKFGNIHNMDETNCRLNNVPG